MLYAGPADYGRFTQLPTSARIFGGVGRSISQAARELAHDGRRGDSGAV